MKKKQKMGLLSMLLCAALLFGLVPSTTVQAAEDKYLVIWTPAAGPGGSGGTYLLSHNFYEGDPMQGGAVVPSGFRTDPENPGLYARVRARVQEGLVTEEKPQGDYSYFYVHKTELPIACEGNTITLRNFNGDYSSLSKALFEAGDPEGNNPSAGWDEDKCASPIIEANDSDLTIVVIGNCTIVNPYGDGIDLQSNNTLRIVKGSSDASLTIKALGSHSGSDGTWNHAAIGMWGETSEFYNEVNLTLMNKDGYMDVTMAGSNKESRIHNTGTINGVGDADEEDEDVSVEEEEAEDEDVSDSTTQPAEVNWENTVSDLIESMTSSDSSATDDKGNMNVEVGEDIDIPQNVLDAVESSGTTLALQTGKGLCFSISKSNLTRTMRSRGLNLNVSVGRSNFPDDVRRQYTQAGLQTKEFGMEYRGLFGGVVNVHFSLGAENAGKTATLYSYTEGGKVTQCGVYKINAEGQAMYGITYGANYLIVIR